MRLRIVLVFVSMLTFVSAATVAEDSWGEIAIAKKDGTLPTDDEIAGVKEAFVEVERLCAPLIVQAYKMPYEEILQLPANSIVKMGARFTFQQCVNIYFEELEKDGVIPKDIFVRMITAEDKKKFKK